MSRLTPWIHVLIAGLLIGAAGLLRLGDVEVGLVALGGLAAPMAAGWVVIVWSLVSLEGGMPSWRRTAWLVSLVLVGAAFGFGTWYGYMLHGELRLWEFRSAVELGCLSTAVVVLAMSFRPGGGTVPSRGRGADRVGRKLCFVSLARWQIWLIAACGVVAAGSGMIALWVLDGMPHMSDAMTYLIQGRLLVSGAMATAPPAEPDLFSASLFFVMTDTSYFSKYPPGWPVVLGLFDLANLAWLASPILAGLSLYFLGDLVRVTAGRTLAMLTVLLVVLCPWYWLNAATFMSHVASMTFLLGFLWGFEHFRRSCRAAVGGKKGVIRAVVAGGFLAVGMVTRPQDVAFFSLPAIAWGVYALISQTRRYGAGLAACAAAALPGAVGWVWINRTLTGGATTSTYGRSPTAEIARQAPSDLIEWVSWFHQNLFGLNVQWAAGAFSVAVAVWVGLTLGRRRLLRSWLLVGSGLSLLLGYSVFIFISTPWVGPRWLLPVVPAFAYIMACGIHAAYLHGRMAVRRDGWFAAFPSRVYLAVMLWALVLTWTVVMPAKLIQLRLQPPHGVDSRVTDAIAAAGLDHAVLALPVEFFIEGTDRPTYKDPRAGMWLMTLPFDRNPVIVVREIEGWEEKARRSFPGRSLYRMSDEPDVFDILPVPVPGIPSPDSDGQPEDDREEAEGSDDGGA